jgi:hypothetical protein
MLLTTELTSAVRQRPTRRLATLPSLTAYKLLKALLKSEIPRSMYIAPFSHTQLIARLHVQLKLAEWHARMARRTFSYIGNGTGDGQSYSLVVAFSFELSSRLLP